MGKFEEVYAINVNDKTEKKGNLTYLSWAWAWAEFKKVYPEAKYEVKKFGGLPYVKEEGVGVMVYTEVTAGDQTYEMWLPVMDGRNNTVLQPKMTEINKTIMRCLTKNLAMFGLGLYIYAGEDLPEDEGGKALTNGQNKAVTDPKTNDRAKLDGRLMKTEMVEKWGVKNVEEAVAWFEGKFGAKMSEWTEEETEAARGILEQRKIKRDRETARMREELKNAGEELPFKV